MAAQLGSANAKVNLLQELTDKLERALQSQKMIVRLRDGTIKRIQEGRGAGGGADAGADAAREELEVLRAQVDYRMESLQREMGALQRRLGERDATAFNSSVAWQLAEVLQLKNDLSRQLEGEEGRGAERHERRITRTHGHMTPHRKQR